MKASLLRRLIGTLSAFRSSITPPSNLRNLKYLNFEANDISNLPVSLNQLKLSRFNIVGNKNLTSNAIDYKFLLDMDINIVYLSDTPIAKKLSSTSCNPQHHLFLKYSRFQSVMNKKGMLRD